jgi:hypothetical protein
MGDLRPLGSEKLEGMDKIKRIMEIARYNETPKQEINESSTTNYTIKLADGNTYGIVKEKLGYIIKKGLNESTLDYSDSIRHRKYYRSYSEAMKKLNLMVSEINRVTGHVEEIPLIGEQSEPKKKFILKQNKPKPSPTPDLGSTPEPAAPAPATETTPPSPDPMSMGSTPSTEEPTPMGDDLMGTTDTDSGMGSDIPSMGTDTETPAGDDMPTMDDDMPTMDDDMPSMDDEIEGGVGLKTIQKLTGRLSQKLRALDKEKGMDSQDIKYVINSVLSAVNLSNLDEDDREDILDKLDSFEDYGMGEEGNLNINDTSDDFGMGNEPTDDFGLNNNDTMGDKEPAFNESIVESVLSRYFKISENEKPIIEEKRKKDYLKNKLNKITVKSEVESLSESKIQLEKSMSILENYKDAKFIGKTNKENLVFIIEGKQYKVTPRGRVL